MENILPTPECITEHILFSHLRQCVVTRQWLKLSLGWQQLENGHYSPIVSRVPAAPKAVVKPVKCSCATSKCSGRCSCKAHTCNLAYTELCKCAEDTCSNIVIDQNSSSSDDEENEGQIFI